jgi:phage tail sheath gpL-like
MSNVISTATRKPGIYSKYNTTLANRGLPANAQKMCIIAQKTSGGSGTAAVPYKIDSETDAITYAGTGSHGHLACRAALKSYPYIDLSLVPIADSGSSKAIGTIVCATTANASGYLDLWIGNYYLQVSIPDTTTANAAAALINTAINAIEHMLPVVSTVDTATVTLTARNAGTQGNQIAVAYKNNGIGAMTFTVTQPTGGSTDPDIANSLTAIYGTKYDFVVVCNNDATNLGKLKAHMASVGSPQESRPAFGVFGYVGVKATLETLCGTTMNSENLTCGYHPYTKTTENGHSLDFEIAAAYAAQIIAENDPAMPLNGNALEGIAPANSIDRVSRTQVESLLLNGVTPLEVGAGEQVRITRAITTYTKNASSIPDSSMLEVPVMRALHYGRYAIETDLSIKFAKAKNTTKTAAKVKTSILNTIRILAELEIWDNVKSDELIVQRDSVDYARLNTFIPAYVVPGLHVIANEIALFL